MVIANLLSLSAPICEASLNGEENHLLLKVVYILALPVIFLTNAAKKLIDKVERDKSIQDQFDMKEIIETSIFQVWSRDTITLERN